MKKIIKNTVALLLSVIFLCAVTPTTYADQVKADEAYQKVRSHLSSLAQENTPIVGSIGGEWLVICLARSGADTSAWKKGYYENVTEYVKTNINDSEQLHKNKSTENSRIILGLTALGYDVTDVAGHNLLMGLTNVTYLKRQGINGPIWALIAFDSHNYEIPDGGVGSSQVTREKLIELILSYQLEDGGWALSGTKADPDMTGMAVQSLAKYYDQLSSVKTAIDRAVTCMAGMISEDGTLSSWGTVNSESCAQVITALTALGVDPTADSRFAKDNGNLIDSLLRFFVDDRGFAHVLSDADGYTGGEYNQMATEQAFYALTAYFRLKNGQASLYNMTDVEIGKTGGGVLYGDVNGDLTVNSGDAAMIYAHHNGKLTFSEQQLQCADVNGDGDVNSADAAMVYAYHNGKINTFPASN